MHLCIYAALYNLLSTLGERETEESLPGGLRTRCNSFCQCRERQTGRRRALLTPLPYLL